MDAHSQWALTDVVLFIQRHTPIYRKGGAELPDPLADPLVDINIQPGEAKPYMVKEGEFIQVLRSGRECSDFQALHALYGIERDIDPTTTRSLMGSLVHCSTARKILFRGSFLLNYSRYRGATRYNWACLYGAVLRELGYPGISIVRTT